LPNPAQQRGRLEHLIVASVKLLECF
jgi:hypothetical protein